MENNINHISRVLLLEDEPIIGRATARTLATDGYEVEIATDGFMAKDKVNAQNNFEFLILDIKTPGMNGIQLYNYLEQEHPKLAERVIFVTGDSLGDTTKTFLETVRRPFLTKPYNPLQLKNLIRQVLP